MKLSARELLKRYGRLYSEELGIDLRGGRESEVFKWFLASLLFGGRISETIAKKTFKQFEQARVLSPARILSTGWEGLVGILDSGGYVRYDESKADRLLLISRDLKREYGGKLSNLYNSAKDRDDLESRLTSLGKGIGPITADIFLREMQDLWPKAIPHTTPLERKAMRKLGIKDARAWWRANAVKGYSFKHFQAALVRYAKERSR